ncbi:MAG: hypothetical protein B7Z55_15250, partial [Planctomycetales bacterium 12-60-4]
RLTDAAEPVWERITECARELRQAAAAGMTEQERLQLKSLLSRAFANLSALPPVRETTATKTVETRTV